MTTFLKFLAAFLILTGCLGALDTLSDRPSHRQMPFRYVVTAGLVMASWWFSRL